MSSAAPRGLPSPAAVDLRGIRKRYGDLEVISGVDLAVAPGEFVAILGPSGCGKSTLLRLLAGLDSEYEGQAQVSGTVGFVFQEPRLLPWLSVLDNVAFALRQGERAARRDRARPYLELVGLGAFADALPKQLSGGMAQRAALARALARQPQVLLLDEPFGALDALTRMRLQDALADIWAKERVTTLLVTHDIEEALYLGDRVMLLSARPASVRRVLEVGLPRPRDRADLAFVELRRDCLAALEV